jgi:tetratricopeptide (TPR) repeat protein
MKKIYFLFFSFLPLIFISQNKTADSLKELIKADKNDSAKVHHLVQLAQELEHLTEGFKINSGVDSIYKRALERARAAKSKTLESYALLWLWSYHSNYMNCIPALQYCREDSVLLSQMSNRSDIEQNLCHLAMTYERMPKGLQAAENSYKVALKMKEEDKDTSGIIFVLGQMQFLWDNAEGMAKSFEAYHRMLRIFKAKNNILNMAHLYESLGDRFYFNARNYKKALQYYLKSLEIGGDSADRWNLAHKFEFIANFNEELGNYKEAIKYYEKAIKADERGSITSVKRNIFIADCYVKLNEYKNAKLYLDKFLKYLDEDSKVSRKIKNFNQHWYIGVYLSLAKLNELQAKNDQALVYCKKAASSARIVMAESKRNLSPEDTILDPQFITAYTALGKMFVKLDQKDSAKFYLSAALNEAMMATDPDYKLETVRAMKQLDSLKGNQDGEYAHLYARLKSEVDSIESKKQKEKERINLVLLEKEKEYFPGMITGGNPIQNTRIDLLKLSLFLFLIFFLAGVVIFISRKN